LLAYIRSRVQPFPHPLFIAWYSRSTNSSNIVCRCLPLVHYPSTTSNLSIKPHQPPKMLKITSLISLLALTPVALGTALLPRSDLTLSGNGGLPTSPNPAYILKRQSCATGKTVCGSGCMPALTTNTCCTTYYCDSGRKCDTDGACTCLATEKKCGTSCIPATASCCPLDLRYCDAAYYCSPVKGYCCKNVSFPPILCL